MISRRTLMTAAAAMPLMPAMARAQDNPFNRLLTGAGVPEQAVVGYAAIAFRKPGEIAARTEVGGMAVDGLRAGRILRLDSPMRIASISKLVTAIGFMRLHEQGRIGLDDDVSELLKFTLRHPLFPDVAITPRMLLSHTSGLRNGPSYPVGLGRELKEALTPGGLQWDDGAWFGPADQPPGQWFAYADVNFAIIAQLIERMTGERFDLYMTRWLFKPLGLECGFNWSGVSRQFRNYGAALYRKAPSDDGPWDARGPWVAQLDAEIPPEPQIALTRAPEGVGMGPDDYEGGNGFVFSPQGGLRASARDLEVIARLIAGGGQVDTIRILKPETQALMATPVWTFDPAAPNGDAYGGAILSYGLGLQILTDSGGDSLFPGCAGWIGHPGDAYGLVSGLWVQPSTGRGFVYLVNGTAAPLESLHGRSKFTAVEETIATAMATA
ncbi:MAG: serine hydrolase [Caulobacter sp.]|nr:serine hydrolase [Caulobacter sp.]